jgi:Flp pilus assembly protein TadG
MNRSQNSKSSARERGATLVEFAIVSTVLLTLMFSVIDFSRAIYAYHFVSNAAREATRYASVRGYESGSNGSVACSTTSLFACTASAGEVTAYVKSIVPSGIYVNSGAASGTAGYLGVTTTWTGKTGSGATCTSGSQTQTNYSGCVVEVQVQYTYGFDLPYLTSLSKINMTSTSQFVISQ